MKAVVLEQTGGPENLAVKEVDTPEPGPGEVRVALRAAALNRRDYWMTIGRYPNTVLPCIPGSDGAGVVDKLGEGVDPVLRDSEVVIYPARNWGDNPLAFGENFQILGMPEQGTFAEYICAPADCIRPKPGHLNWQQAAAVPLAGLTSWRAAITHGEVREGSRVLVTGAGSGVSTFALLWCVHSGAEVHVSSGSEAKIKAAVSLGAAGGVSYRDENCYTELAQKTGGFDVIIDSAVGNALNQLLDTLNPGGRYIFFGATLGNPERGLEMARLFYRHIRLQGTTMGRPEEFSAMLDFLGRHRIEPVIDRVLPLDKAVEAHRLLESFSQTGKIVLQIT